MSDLSIHIERSLDEYNGVYSADGKRLLKCPNVKRYRIQEGCEQTDEYAFDGCDKLVVLYLPYTFSEDEADKTLNNMPITVGNFCVWDRPRLLS